MFKTIGLLAASALALCSATAASAYDHQLTIHNNSSYTIIHLYASQHAHGTWEDDIFPDDNQYISPGYHMTVDLYDGNDRDCHMDIMTIDTQGNQAVKANYDVCAQTDLYITD